MGGGIVKNLEGRIRSRDIVILGFVHPVVCNLWVGCGQVSSVPELSGNIEMNPELQIKGLETQRGFCLLSTL